VTLHQTRLEMLDLMERELGIHGGLALSSIVSIHA
jgi:hypothetical protein